MIKKSIDSKTIEDLQNKVWKPGTMQVLRIVESGQQNEETKDQLQNKVWDPGKIKGKGLLTRRSIIFYLGSLMKEHPLSKNLMEDLVN